MKIDLFIRKLFEEAAKQPFEDYEIYFVEGESFTVKVFSGEVDDYRTNTFLGLSFRGKIDGKMGYSYTEAFDEKAIGDLISKAIGNAKIIENDDAQFIYTGDDRYETVNSWYEAVDAFSAQDKISLALSMEKAAKGISPLVKQVGHCLVQSFDSMTRIKNSKGLDVEQHANGLFGYIVPVLERDGKMTDGSAYFVVTDPKSIDVAALSQEAFQAGYDKMTAVQPMSGNYKIVIRNEAMQELLDANSSIFSADAAQKGLSLLAGKEGQKIAAPCVTIVDDPHRKDGFAGGAFDAEGVATRRMEIVSGGMLTTLLHNLKTAAKAGAQSTGHAAKSSYKSSVSVSPTNFYLEPGDASYEELLVQMGEGIVITELAGLHAGLDAISGDFSLSARGYAVEGGKQTKAVEQMVVSGNFFQLLQSIQAIGSDLKFGMPDTSYVGSPSVLISKLDIAGK